MNRVDIYYCELNKDIIMQINALIEKGALISLLSIDKQLEGNCSNEKVNRLIRAYGEKVFPVVLVNGEIALVEADFDINDVLGYLELNKKELQQLDIINNCCCDKTNMCSGCHGCKDINECYNCSNCKGNSSCCDKCIGEQ